MRTKLTVVTALAGSLLATCLVSKSAKAMSVPVLRGGADSRYRNACRGSAAVALAV